jgi:molecular chaperone DnaK
VTFEIDRNGILNVSALDIDTGVQNQIQITEVSYSGKNLLPARRGKDLVIF